MGDFSLITSTGSTSYVATQEGYDQCRADFIRAVRNHENPKIDGRSIGIIESTSGSLPKDVRQTLGLE